MTHASSSPAQDDSCLQQPRLDCAKSDQLFFYGGHSWPQQGSTGRHRPFQHGKPRAPTCSLLPPWALKLMLPPAQECQIAPLGTPATPVEPKWHQGLAADTRYGQRPPKCDSNSSRIWHQANKKTSIRASKHPSLGSQRSAAEAVAFSIYMHNLTYLCMYTCC